MVVVPYSKCTAVLNPCGSTEPLSVAEKLAMKLAELVITTGGPVALSVVNVLSLPRVVPPVFVATIRKWNVVLASKPLMFALTLWYVLPLLVWTGVLSP